MGWVTQEEVAQGFAPKALKMYSVTVALGWVEPPSERSERWRRYWVSEETRGMTGWETGFD